LGLIMANARRVAANIKKWTFLELIFF
jgi:hypothetical protein